MPGTATAGQPSVIETVYHFRQARPVVPRPSAVSAVEEEGAGIRRVAVQLVFRRRRLISTLSDAVGDNARIIEAVRTVSAACSSPLRHRACPTMCAHGPRLFMTTLICQRSLRLFHHVRMAEAEVAGRQQCPPCLGDGRDAIGDGAAAPYQKNDGGKTIIALVLCSCSVPAAPACNSTVQRMRGFFCTWIVFCRKIVKTCIRQTPPSLHSRPA